MKYVLLVLLIIFPLHGSYDTGLEAFQLLIEPKWENLQPDFKESNQFGGKWILVGSITFKKKSKESVNLSKLELHWNGATIDELTGSLYYKQPDKYFLPLEENLVCDGTWNKTQQTLKLTFDKNHMLGLTNIFYLVLTIPDHLEPIIKLGNFEIVQQLLPEPFRVATATHKLCLSLDALDSNPQEMR